MRCAQIDLVPEEELVKLEQRISGLNAGADVIRTKHCSVPLDKLLGRGCFNSRQWQGLDEALDGAAQSGSHSAGAAGIGHLRLHDSHVGTVCLQVQEPLDLTKYANLAVLQIPRCVTQSNGPQALGT